MGFVTNCVGQRNEVWKSNTVYVEFASKGPFILLTTTVYLVRVMYLQKPTTPDFLYTII